MRRLRTAFGLLVASALLAAGCGSDGAYTVSWNFFASFMATAEGDPTQDAAAACGAHGVDAILVTGVSSGGDRHQTTGVCAQGTLTHGIGKGQWQLTLSQLDVRGDSVPLPYGVSDPQVSVEVAEGKTAVASPDIVTLVPRPACADGVDNDHDGRVDLDDPDCGGDPTHDSEAAAP